MKKSQKKKLTNLLVSLILMLIVTVVGYFKGEFEENTNEQILAKPRNTRDIIQFRRDSRI